jgi:hypothetical protein
MNGMLATIIMIGVVIMVIIIINRKENFGSLIGSMDSMPKLKNSETSLFLNNYPKYIGKDFGLMEYIQKLRLNNLTGTMSISNSKTRMIESKNKKLKPIIIIPGLGASNIYGIWNKEIVDSMKTLDDTGNFEKQDIWSCKKNQETYTKIWPCEEEGLGKRCWLDNIKVYADDNGGIRNSSTVKTITDGFGSLNFSSGVYDYLIESLKSVGYVEEENLFGAVYDFRRISDENELNVWCLKMTKLIEKLSSLTGEKVIIIGHDLGSMVGNYFLVNTLKRWKDIYINSFISVSGTFGGSSKAVKTILSGEDGSSNFSGLSLMLPYAEIYGDNPLVSTNEMTYTSYDLEKILPEETIKVLNNSRKIRNESMMAPETTVYLVMGDGISTESSYKYERTMSEEPEKNYPVYRVNLPYSQNFDYDDYYIGDGTIPKFALEYPIGWKQNEKIYYKFFIGAEHSKILSMSEPIKYIINIVMYA